MIDPGREVTLVAGDATYTLYAGNRALRLMERETGLPLLELTDRLEQIDISLVTTLLWTLLQRHHPDLTLDDVDDVIDAAGYEVAMTAVTDAMGRAFPQADGADEKALGKPRPRGTGTTSSRARSRPGSASPSSGT